MPAVSVLSGIWLAMRVPDQAAGDQSPSAQMLPGVPTHAQPLDARVRGGQGQVDGALEREVQLPAAGDVERSQAAVEEAVLIGAARLGAHREPGRARRSVQLVSGGRPAQGQREAVDGAAAIAQLAQPRIDLRLLRGGAGIEVDVRIERARASRPGTRSRCRARPPRSPGPRACRAASRRSSARRARRARAGSGRAWPRRSADPPARPPARRARGSPCRAQRARC